eukprot:12540759-Prorocentrum_lima.AAC.1
MDIWCWSVTFRCAASALLALEGTTLQDSSSCLSWQAAVRQRLKLFESQGWSALLAQTFEKLEHLPDHEKLPSTYGRDATLAVDEEE